MNPPRTPPLSLAAMPLPLLQDRTTEHLREQRDWWQWQIDNNRQRPGLPLSELIKLRNACTEELDRRATRG